MFHPCYLYYIINIFISIKNIKGPLKRSLYSNINIEINEIYKTILEIREEILVLL